MKDINEVVEYINKELDRLDRVRDEESNRNDERYIEGKENALLTLKFKLIK